MFTNAWGGRFGYGAQLLLLLAFAALTAFCCELAHRGSLRRTLGFVQKRPLHFLSNLLLALALEMALTAVLGYLYRAVAAAFAICYLFACVSYFKYAYRNEPLYASDLALASSVFTVANTTNFAFRMENTLPAMGMTLLFVFTYPTGEALLLPHFRIFDMAFAVLLFLLTVYIFLDLRRPDFTYLESGFLAGFLFNALYLIRKKPTPARAAAAEPPVQGYPPGDAPDVVIVLSESFWDATKLTGVEFSEDPIPFFRALSGKCVHGDLMVTPFGGGTCNVEAELLLGVVCRHFNLSDTLYRKTLRRPVPSLATAFRGLGYRATALHTFSGDFYKRDAALRHMGFDEFRAAESINNPRMSGQYIDDSCLTDMIFETLDAAEQPSFVFAISMENHQPYTARKFEKPSISASGAMLGKQQAAVEAYAHGLRDADRELERLIDYCERRTRPTVVLFFGDHLGALGEDFALYRACGLVESSMGALSPAEISRLYAPPYLLWSSNGNEAKAQPPTGANFLGGLLLDAAGAEKPAHFRFLEQLQARARCLSREDCFLDGDGALLRSMTPDMRQADGEYKAESLRVMGM